MSYHESVSNSNWSSGNLVVRTGITSPLQKGLKIPAVQ